MRSNTIVYISIAVAISISSLVQAEESMTLSSFLALVRKQNPDLQIEAAKVAASDAKSVGLAIPPPMVGVNQMKEDTGNTAVGFEVSQTIPFPTKLTSDHSSRKFEAKAQNEFRRARENEILAQAKNLYFSLWAMQERVKLFQDKREVLRNHIKLSRSTARSDSSASLHVLRAESDLDLLENEILSEEQKLLTAKSEIAVFLNQDPEIFKMNAQEPPLSSTPQNISLNESPQVKMTQFSLETLRAKESQAKSSWFPDFNIRYKQMGQTSMFSRYNEVMVGVTLPFVFFWEPNSESQAASAQSLQAEYQLEKQKRSFESERINTLKKIEVLKKQLDTLKEKLIPRAEKRMKLVHNIAPRDMESLQDHRETMEALPDLKLKALDLRREYEQAVSSLEKYLPAKEVAND